MACTNGDGTERVPTMVIGTSKNPRCFNGQGGFELGIDYHASKKAWMTSDLFYAWLLRFDSYIGSTPIEVFYC